MSTNEKQDWQKTLALFQITRDLPTLDAYMQKAQLGYPDRGSEDKVLLKGKVVNGHLEKVPVVTLESVMDEANKTMSDENDT